MYNEVITYVSRTQIFAIDSVASKLAAAGL